MGIDASDIGRCRDRNSESCVFPKSNCETQVDCDLVCAAGVETENRDGEIASLWIEITPRFQISSRIAGLDRPRSRPLFLLNLELGEREVGNITDLSLDETDEWRWTFGQRNLSNHLRRLGCNREHAQECDHTGN